MSTVLIQGVAARKTRDRIFDCPYCGCKFIGTSSDTGFTVASLAELQELGITAKCTCPTCEGTAVSTAGSAGEIPTVVGLVILSLPTKQLYKPGDTFDATGMVIGVKDSNGAVREAAVAEYTLSPTTSTPLALTDKKITVTHTASSKTIDVPIAVRNAEIIKPRMRGGQFVYDGEAHTPAVDGYDSETMTRSGDTSKTSAGEYAVKYTPKTGYAWEDGTTDTLSLAWVITKAAPAAPTVSPTTLELDDTTSSGTFSVTRTGNGTVSAVSSDEAVATVSVSGTTVTVTGVATGEAVVAVTVAEGTNYLAPAAVLTCAVTVALTPTEETPAAEG